MIRYRLQCKDGHEFEAWFRSGSDYDAQIKRDEVTCPSCGSASVSKALMAPQIAVSRTEPATTERPPATGDDARRFEMQRQFLALMQQVRREVQQKADYVGDRFAEEARKIHYEESEPRGIYGEATLDEARELDEEGIKILPLPPLPDDHN